MLLSDAVLGIILIAAILAAITFLGSLWVFVPFVPTPPQVVRKMVDLAKLKANDTVYDLGCGDGRILIAAVRRIPSIKAIGYELPLGVWMLAKCRVFFSRLPINIKLKDYRKVDLSDADVIFLYLFPEVMQPLIKKFDQELAPGTTVISHGFPFEGKNPIHEERVTLPTWHFLRTPKTKGPRVFVYTW